MPEGPVEKRLYQARATVSRLLGYGKWGPVECKNKSVCKLSRKKNEFFKDVSLYSGFIRYLITDSVMSIAHKIGFVIDWVRMRASFEAQFGLEKLPLLNPTRRCLLQAYLSMKLYLIVL